MEYIATSYKIEKQKATEIVRHYFSIFLGVTMKYMFFFDNELIWGVPKMGVSQIIPRWDHFSIETYGDDWGSP